MIKDKTKWEYLFRYLDSKCLSWVFSMFRECEKICVQYYVDECAGAGGWVCIWVSGSVCVGNFALAHSRNGLLVLCFTLFDA